MAITEFHPVSVGVRRYCKELSNKKAAVIGYKLPKSPDEATEWSFVGADPKETKLLN